MSHSPPSARPVLWPWLVGSLVLVSIVSALGGSFTASSLDSWYRTLEKPAQTPPDGLFPLVWSLLYAAMGVAAFLVFRAGGGFQAPRMALGAYGLQLALNLAWSWLFFGLRQPFAAGVEILVLWGAIVLSIALFWRWSRTAGILLLPYLAWVSFAAWLNWRIVGLNPGA